MKKKFSAIGFFIFLAGLWAASAKAQDITVLTTTWAPFVYEENGALTGLSTEIVRAVLQRAGLNADIKLYPWKRAIATATTQENVLIFPLMKTPEREKSFIWVVPLFNAGICLYKMKDRNDITLSSLEDAREYTIGVLRGGAMHQYLLAHGFEDGKQLVAMDSNRKSIELLFRGRVDLLADNPMVLVYEAKQLGFSPSQAVEIFQLFESEAYMAFGKGSSGIYVRQLKAAFENLKADGTIAGIFGKYQ